MKKIVPLLGFLLLSGFFVTAFGQDDEEIDEENTDGEESYDDGGEGDGNEDGDEYEEETKTKPAITTKPVPLDEHTTQGFDSSTWENGTVPYVIDVKFESYERKRIEDAINAMNTQAICVQFRKKQEDDLHYLSFVRNEAKCQSEFIGFAEVGEQPVYLAPNCSTARYIYWVLLQALGLPAEHMRPDRDKFISIKWENIDRKYAENFKKYAFIDQRIAKLEYDFASRLHYSDEKFTVQRNRKTIVTLDDPSRELGNPLSPTFFDYKKVAALYCNGDVLPDPVVNVEIPVEPDDGTQTAGPWVSSASGNSRVVPTRKPRPNALPAIIAGLAPLLEPVAVNRNVSANCICLDRPDANGSCDDSAGFQFKGMYQQCRLSSRAQICKCENILLNPCWCEASVGSCRGANCPLTTCVKKCRTKY